MQYSVNNKTESIEIVTDSCTPLQFGLLEELLDINRAVQSLGVISVKIDTLYNYQIDYIDIDDERLPHTGWEYIFNVLGFPPVFEEAIVFSYSGAPGQILFAIETLYNHRKVRNSGPFLLREKDGFVLGSIGPELYEFYRLSLSFPNISIQRLLNNHRILLARAKRLAKLNILKLENLTDSRDFYEAIAPIKVKITANSETTRLGLVPDFTSESLSEEIQASWETVCTEKNPFDRAINLHKPTEKKGFSYLILNEDQNIQVNILQELTKKAEENQDIIRTFLKNPEQFIDPEIIDIDELSDRIAELGYFRTVHIPGYQNVEIDWWGNMTIPLEDKQKKFEINQMNINSLLVDLESAEKDRLKSFVFEKNELQTDEIRKAVDAYNTFRATVTAEKNVNEEKQVLIAKSNLDELEYSIQNDSLSIRSFEALQSKPCFVLKGHQMSGISWLQSLYNSGKKGGLLADDMGLGKTLQVMYFIEWLQEKKIKRSEKSLIALIVLPLSLINNWKSEYEKYFSHGQLFFYDESLDEFLTIKERLRQDYGAVHLVTYQALQRKQIQYAAVKWDVIIADEIQYSKNPGSRITNALKILQSNFRLAMTGTPVENSYIELWNIVDWVSPGLLGSLSSFQKKYGVNKYTTAEELNTIARKIRVDIGDVLLRRTKAEVLADELPHKYVYHETVPVIPEIVLNVDMSEFQLYKYKEIRSAALQSFKKGQALGYIQKMKIVSDHPRFIDERNIFNMNNFDECIVHESSKTIPLGKIIDAVKEKKEKILIFCEFRFTQHFLSGWISEKYGIKVPILNGLSPVRDKRKTRYSQESDCEYEGLSRQNIVSVFNSSEGFAVMVLSPIAAGVGLNIIGANHVVHFSRHWNPAKEDQATDRVYRIGQKKDVHVYYPKAVSSEFSTFDVNVARILEKKRTLSREALFPSNYDGSTEGFEMEFFK